MIYFQIHLNRITMKKLFFLLTILGLLCSACGGSTAQNDSHTQAEGTTHVHSADCGDDHSHDNTAPEQEHFVVEDHDCDHEHEEDFDHDHAHDGEAHSHEDHSAHIH